MLKTYSYLGSSNHPPFPIFYFAASCSRGLAASAVFPGRVVVATPLSLTVLFTGSIRKHHAYHSNMKQYFIQPSAWHWKRNGQTGPAASQAHSFLTRAYKFQVQVLLSKQFPTHPKYSSHTSTTPWHLNGLEQHCLLQAPDVPPVTPTRDPTQPKARKTHH